MTKLKSTKCCVVDDLMESKACECACYAMTVEDIVAKCRVYQYFLVFRKYLGTA